MNYTLTLSDVADEEVRTRIVTPLVEYNASQAGPSHGRPIVVLVKDEAGGAVGGLWGNTGYEWLFTQLLVVPASLRGRGVGTEIMKLAEAEALQRGCHSAWLDTFEFQARGFYERLGYECFGELPNYPNGFSRFFMKKALRASTRRVGERQNPQNTKHENTSLANSQFNNVDLSGSRFEDVNLRNSQFADVALNGTRLTDIDFGNVVIETSNLDGMSINGILVSDLLIAYQRSRGSQD